MWGLKVGTRYYWQVSYTVNGLKTSSAIATFNTENHAPRLMRVGGAEDGPNPIPYRGVLNMRDIGGYHTKYGRRVRQGLIYRSAGLNNNATVVYHDLEELATMPQYRELYKQHIDRQRTLTVALDSARKSLLDPHLTTLIPYPLHHSWTAFRPDENKLDATTGPLLDALKTIPQTLLGAAPETMTTSRHGATFFAEPREADPAIFMQEFDSPSNGYIQLGCGADWFWDIRINGVKVFDKLSGNTIAPVSATNYTLHIPVKKGRNLIVALVRSGCASWTWCCGSAEPVDSQAAVEKMIEHLETATKETLKVVKERHPGASRLDESTIDYLRNHLGIKTDIDFRKDQECYGMTESPLGPDVAWLRHCATAYGRSHQPVGHEFFRNFFRAILDRNIYPFIMHCIGGKDRTGSITLILHGLLGVSEEELFLEWEMSGFFEYSPGFDHEGCFYYLTRGFDTYPGADINEKIEAYALQCGITPSEIEAFRDLMLE
ncbi:MAG: tyrosine-protein phosphatase [Lentisphaerae bacterium]|nr:tyrosine-protein phosphatase [Lentisphaerota bacterium]